MKINKMKRKILIFAFLFWGLSCFMFGYIANDLTSKSYAWFDKPTKSEIALETVWIGLHIVDWGQTLDIARQPTKYREFNPLIGDHPSVGKINLYMGTWIIAHPIISYVLPSKYRTYWQWGSIFVTTGCVINNQIIGVKFNF